MITDITPEALKTAREAAEQLKERLAPKILGQTRPGWSCSCGTIAHGEAEAVGFTVPSGEHEDQIALNISWTVNMRSLDNCDKSYSLGLSEFLSSQEIYSMFREVFRGIEVPLDIAHANLIYGAPVSSQYLRTTYRPFELSDNKVPLKKRLYLRPKASNTEDVFNAVEITLTDKTINVVVDPFSIYFGMSKAQKRLPKNWQWSRDKIRGTTLYLDQCFHYTPIAQIAQDRSFTLILDSGVEVFSPSAAEYEKHYISRLGK